MTVRCQSSFGDRRGHAALGRAPGRAVEAAPAVRSGIRGAGTPGCDAPPGQPVSLGQEKVVPLLQHVKRGGAPGERRSCEGAWPVTSRGVCITHV